MDDRPGSGNLETRTPLDVTALYASVQPRLLRYLRSMAPASAEDLCSQAWLEALAGLDRFAGDGEDFRRWMFTIGRRRLIDARRRAVRRPVDLRPPDHPVLLNLPDESGEPAGELAGQAAVRTLLARLPADQAEVVLLRVIGGFSADEVGEITGRRAGAVRVIQHRALRQLARALAAAA